MHWFWHFIYSPGLGKKQGIHNTSVLSRCHSAHEFAQLLVAVRVASVPLCAMLQSRAAFSLLPGERRPPSLASWCQPRAFLDLALQSEDERSTAVGCGSYYLLCSTLYK